MKKMNLPCDWQISRDKLTARGRYILETGQWSDCKFIVGQEPQQQILEGHKLFLAMSSPVFEAMFYGSMAEKLDPIPIRDVQPEAFKTLLEYIYTDKVNLGSFELACELCYCAKKYMLPNLVKECTKFLWSDLTINKACRAYEFAKLFEEPELMEKCLSIICNNTKLILNETNWEEVELGTILTVFEQDELNIDNEIELFTAVEKWAKAECSRKSLDTLDSKTLKSVVGNALSKIRFLTLTPQQFAEGPGKSPLLSRDEAFAILMNVSSSGSDIPMPDGFSKNSLHRTNPSRSKEQMTNFFHCSGRPIKPNVKPIPWSAPIEINYNMRNEQQDNSSTSSTIRSVAQSSSMEGTSRDPQKYYCLRTMGQQTDCLNSGVLDCSVTFSVDKNICVIGVQVPTQVQYEVIKILFITSIR